VVGDAKCQFRLRHGRTAFGQATESVERAFMDIVAINPKQGFAVALQNLVLHPELVEQGQRRCHAII